MYLNLSFYRYLIERFKGKDNITVIYLFINVLCDLYKGRKGRKKHKKSLKCDFSGCWNGVAKILLNNILNIPVMMYVIQFIYRNTILTIKRSFKNEIEVYC